MNFNDDNASLPISTPTSSSSSSHSHYNSHLHKDNISHSHFSKIFNRSRYKFYALAAILLLAFWSMLTGTVSLRFSDNNLNSLDNDDNNYHYPSSDDLDVLELEEREKMVRHMWDVYSNNHRMIGLVGFWREAFVAAYEDLTSEVPDVMEAAIEEIARMSGRYIKLDDPTPVRSSEMRIQDLNLKPVVTKL